MKDAEAMRVALAALWQRSLPAMLERLDAVDRAATAARGGGVSAELWAEALAGAHKLSGSLGMFGYHHGTEIAREMEAMLRGELLEGERLGGLVEELRGEIG